MLAAKCCAAALAGALLMGLGDVTGVPGRHQRRRRRSRYAPGRVSAAASIGYLGLPGWAPGRRLPRRPRRRPARPVHQRRAARRRLHAQPRHRAHQPVGPRAQSARPGPEARSIVPLHRPGSPTGNRASPPRRPARPAPPAAPVHDLVEGVRWTGLASGRSGDGRPGSPGRSGRRRGSRQGNPRHPLRLLLVADRRVARADAEVGRGQHHVHGGLAEVSTAAARAAPRSPVPWPPARSSPPTGGDVPAAAFPDLGQFDQLPAVGDRLTKFHGCPFPADGARRPASQMRSRSSRAIG